MTLADLSLRPDEVRALYLVHLQQMRSAEEQLLDALFSLAIHVSADDVRQRLLLNAAQTPQHVARLDAIFTELEETPDGPVCEPMKALVNLSAELSVQHPLGPTRDVLLLAVAKEMKHLGIAKYAMAVTFAQVLGWPQQVAAHARSQQDEVDTDRDLLLYAQNIHLETKKP